MKHMRPTLWPTMLLIAVSPPVRVAAQDFREEATPRALVDSTYAVRLAVDALAESIRRGQLDTRRYADPELAAAIGQLATAAAGRSRRPPRGVGDILWDFQIDLSDFAPEGTDVLRVHARVFLATERDSAGVPLMFVFRRRGAQWDLVAHDGLAARLAAIGRALRSRGRP